MAYNYNDNLRVNTTKHGNGGSLNMRETPSSNGRLITTIPNGTSLPCDLEAESNGWVPCFYMDSYGYVMAKFIEGTDAFGTPSAGEAGNYDGASTINCKATVRGGSLALRNSDDSTGTVIHYIPEDTVIDVNTSAVAITNWLRAVHNNTMGFVRHQYLEVHPSRTSYVVAGCQRYGAPLLSKGASNSYVGILKQDLWNLGWNGMSLNNSFDSALEAAVKEFQSDYGLDDDGIVGNATKDKLYRVVTFG